MDREESKFEEIIKIMREEGDIEGKMKSDEELMKEVDYFLQKDGLFSKGKHISLYLIIE